MPGLSENEALDLVSAQNSVTVYSKLWGDVLHIFIIHSPVPMGVALEHC